MNILVIGSGGREHVLCWKIKQSPQVTNLYCVPGNAGTSECAINFDLDDLENNNTIKDFCMDKKIELVVVGPEAPLARGLTDVLENEGIKVCGPSYAASRMESSKIFAKELMGRYSIPTAAFRIFDDVSKADEYIKEVGAPIVVKADGLAAGKGVVVAQSEGEALEAVRSMLERNEFGAAGKKIVIEECLDGEEVSVLVMSDGTNIVPLASSQDHKRANDGDEGPNTGGMGAYSPAPVLTKKLFDKVKETILQPTIDGLKNEGMDYKGILYAGLMVKDGEAKVLEFNVRFGDPEAQAVLPRLKSDFVDLLLATAEGDLSGVELEWDDSTCVCVVASSGGYPGKYEKGIEIKGLPAAVESGALVFHAGTKRDDGKLVTSGGRVLGIIGMGEDIRDAIDDAYRNVEKITFDGMHYRRDIGYRALNRD